MKKQKIIWITGASSGIGRALSLEMAQRGWLVCATARSAGKLAALAQENAAIYPYPGDVADRTQMETIVAEIERTHGPIDTAVLNAGLYLQTRAVPFEREKYIEQINVNQIGVINGLGALIPRMTQRRGGALWLVSSVTAFGGLPTAAAYGSTKAALINMAECLKFDLDKYGVHIGVISPGFVDTPMINKNTYAKPFMLTPEEAARRIADGMARRGFEITFPRRLSWGYKLISHLPYALYFPLVKTITRMGGRE
jgi:NAD(P)-dependent dehydrogenase (short-subunit alcohol dehydrogenase family)